MADYETYQDDVTADPNAEINKDKRTANWAAAGEGVASVGAVAGVGGAIYNAYEAATGDGADRTEHIIGAVASGVAALGAAGFAKYADGVRRNANEEVADGEAALEAQKSSYGSGDDTGYGTTDPSSNYGSDTAAQDNADPASNYGTDNVTEDTAYGSTDPSSNYGSDNVGQDNTRGDNTYGGDTGAGDDTYGSGTGAGDDTYGGGSGDGGDTYGRNNTSSDY